ncbi:hypothetical protein AV521_31905 [Streptomyces sp. IMTB 2501]|uniref:hypothetical protein n=1 Tax=Streptomyces sp. IMTB 2501 TaxID=1776340 RepID=UPI00096BE812|nr:hypothetical protein [Streptomyces sp. IMTB 2501]OLZ65301.1 hypothetical protein AV521_31905 [Streptomyces sp. IMTB 2501]
MIPPVDRMWKATLRTVTLSIPSLQVITWDNVSIGVTEVADCRQNAAQGLPGGAAGQFRQALDVGA